MEIQIIHVVAAMLFLVMTFAPVVTADCAHPDVHPPLVCNVTGYKVLEEAYCNCTDKNYYLKGESELVCHSNTVYAVNRKDYKWEPALPKCKKQCAELVTSLPLKCENFNNRTHRGAKCSCDDIKYYLDGKKELMCESNDDNDNSNWSAEVPKCIKSCDTLTNSPSPLHCVYTGNKIGDTATCSCEKNYHLNGTEIVKCSTDGLWSPELPNCVKDCNQLVLSSPLNCNTSGLSYRFGEKVKCWCDHNYQLDGPDIIECVKDGRWNAVLPKCINVTTTTTTTTITTITTATTPSDKISGADGMHGNIMAIMVATMWMIMIICGGAGVLMIG